MKRFVLMTMVALMCAVGVAQADLAVEFTYEPAHSSQNAVGYSLYANGTKVCDGENIVGTPPTQFDCDATNLTPGDYNFTMAAQFADGTESPQSPSYAFTIPIPDPNSPNILRVRII